MGLFQSILDTIADHAGYANKKSASGAISDLIGGLPTMYGASKLSNRKAQVQSYTDWVYAAASMVAQEAATIDLHAYKNTTAQPSARIAKILTNHPKEARKLFKRDVGNQQGLDELDNHVLLDLLENPNEQMDGEALMELTYLHLMLAGEAFWAKIRNGLGKPESLWPMFPYFMAEQRDDKRFISGWKYTINGVTSFWDADDIVQIKLTDPTNLYRGTGIVQAAARAIDTDAHAADWNRNFFQNSARPDFVLETDNTLSDTVFQRLKLQWEDRHKGVINAFKIGILEAGLKLNNVTMSQKDMDFLAGRNFNKDQILAMFGVSATILGLVSDANRANMEAADYNHAKRVIKPLQSRVASAINHKLAPEYDTKLVIGFTDPVPEDKQFMLDEQTKGENVIWTINEIREMRGLDPVDGGDLMYQPINMQPIGTPPPTPVAVPPPDDNNDDDKTDPENDPKDPSADKAAALIKKAFTTRQRNAKRSATPVSTST